MAPLDREKVLSTPVRQVVLKRGMTVADLVEAFGGMSIQARNLGMCARIYERMLEDPERPTVFLGLSGPLIAAGLRRVIRDLIACNMVDVVVSTGAILYQDFYQARGGGHYIGSPEMDDLALREILVDRIYDTLVDEEKFDETDQYIGRLAMDLERRPHSSREFLHYLGSVIDDENSILRTAYEHGIPVFSPALNDSSIGIGLTWTFEQQGPGGFTIDAIRDNHEITQIIAASGKTGAVYIGGGTPKNWVNDAVVMANYALKKEKEGHEYAVQITTATPLDGGLSGSTLKEAQSWGKVYREAKKAMCHVEASIGLPLIAAYLMDREAGRDRGRLEFKWNGHNLEEMRVRGKVVGSTDGAAHRCVQA